jgi:hypothetical protein
MLPKSGLGCKEGCWASFRAVVREESGFIKSRKRFRKFSETVLVARHKGHTAGGKAKEVSVTILRGLTRNKRI